MMTRGMTNLEIERVTGLGRRTRKETAKWNQMTALRFQTGELVSWCFEPSQPQRITSGLNKNFTLSAGYSFHKSSYHKSCFFLVFFLAYLYSAGTQHGNPHQAG